MKKKKNILDKLGINIDEHFVSKTNITQYTNKLKTFFDKKLDKSNLNVSVYTVDSVGEQHNVKFSQMADANTMMYRGEGGRTKVGVPIQDDDVATKKYVDDAVIAPGFVTKEYVDRQDADNLAAAKAYTDEKDATQKEYIDEQDASTLSEAKAYTDEKDATQKEYIDEQDAETLQAAKDYADAGLNNKVDKLKQANKVYVTNGAGADTSRDMSSAANPNSIPIRDGKSCFKVGTPQEDGDAANKKYVDDAIEESKGKVEVGRWVILGEAVKDKTPLEIFGYGVWSDVAEKYGEGALRAALNNYDVVGSDTITQTVEQLAEHNHYCAFAPWVRTGGYSGWNVGSTESAAATDYRYFIQNNGSSVPMVNIQKSLNIRVLEREA